MLIGLGDNVPYFIMDVQAMIDKQAIVQMAEAYAGEHGLFLVDVTVLKGNRIIIYIDSMQGVNIDDCAGLSRHIESLLNREEQDFELEVSSPGLDHPLKHPMQYEKNLGKELRVMLRDGKTYTGKLLYYTKELLVLEVEKTMKEGNKKRKFTAAENISLAEIKQTKVKLSFK